MPTSAMRSKLAGLATALAVLALPGAAMAKPVCLTDFANDYVYYFPKPKLPKKAGSTTVATAERFHRLVGNGKTCVGSMTKLANGNVKVGLTCYGGDGASGSMVGWTAADATLTGTAYYDYDGDFDFNDFNVPLNATDCTTLTLP